MFERFSDRSRRVLVLAQDESRRLGHPFIGTEHVLLGLLADDEGLAAQALRESGVTLAGTRDAVLGITGQGKEPVASVPFTPRAKKVLEYSLREALQRGDQEIGTENLLLGLLREGQGIACQVLVAQGVDLQRLRERVLLLANEQLRPRRDPGTWVLEMDRATGSSPAGARPPIGYVLASYRRTLASLLGRLNVPPELAPIGDYAALLLVGALGAQFADRPTGGPHLLVGGRQAAVRAGVAASAPAPPPLLLGSVPADVDDVAIVILYPQDLSVARGTVVAASTLPRDPHQDPAQLLATAEALELGRDITAVLRSFE